MADRARDLVSAASTGVGSQSHRAVGEGAQAKILHHNGTIALKTQECEGFAEVYLDEQILHCCVAKLPWRHNIALVEKLKPPDEKGWYVQKALEYAWSRDVLAIQIGSCIHAQGTLG